ncbi:hypothetical protein LXL04_032009 [Taraxacum kok-saghyz]
MEMHVYSNLTQLHTCAERAKEETKMAAMKLAIFFFTLSTLLGAYHARHLHDGSVYKFFDRRPPVKTSEVIQMVTGEEEPQPPPIPPPSSSQGETNYGPHNPNSPPSLGKTDVAGENLEGRPSPRRPPSQGEDYLNAQPSRKPGSSGGEGVYGRDNPSTPPSPDQNDPHNQGIYGGVDLRNRIPLRAPVFTSDIQMRQDEHPLLSIIKVIESYTPLVQKEETKMAAMNLAIFFFTLSALLGAYHARQLHDGSVYEFVDRRPPVKTAEVIQMVTGEEEPQSPPMPPRPPASSQGDTSYGLDNLNAPPSLGKTNVAGENLEGRPSPRRPPSQGEDYLNAQPSPKPGKSGGEGVYGRDNPSTPPSPDQNDPHNQGMLFESICGNGGRLCMDSTSNFGGLRNRIPLRAPAFTSGVQIRQDEDQLLSIISHWVLSYTIRIFNNWY